MHPRAEGLGGRSEEPALYAKEKGEEGKSKLGKQGHAGRSDEVLGSTQSDGCAVGESTLRERGRASGGQLLPL